MRHLYTLLLYLTLPLILLRLGWRGFSNPGYWRNVAERFGFGGPARSKERPQERPLWIHAVSVGEVQAAKLLVQAIRRREPDLALLITMMTPTGRVRALEVFGSSGEDPASALCYLPYDVPDAIARFIDTYRPRALVLIETELWPNLIHACASRNIPVVLANARLSARSAAGYARVGRLTRELLGGLSAVAAQSADDAGRLVRLGAVPERVQVTGSVKFDLSVPPELEAQAKALRETLCGERPVLLAASTHGPEEAPVLDAFELVRKVNPQVVLVWVPRHPERFDAVAVACSDRGFVVRRRSLERDDVITRRRSLERNSALKGVPGTEPIDVYIGDTMGELLLLYGVADVVFVGGSLTPVGGHNFLEPAALGRALLTGPHVFNFADIAKRLREIDALREVADANALAQAALALVADGQGRAAMGERARAFVANNTGASHRVADLVLSTLDAVR